MGAELLSCANDDSYFRGADTAEEFQRQQDKIVSALELAGVGSIEVK